MLNKFKITTKQRNSLVNKYSYIMGDLSDVIKNSRQMLDLMKHINILNLGQPWTKLSLLLLNYV